MHHTVGLTKKGELYTWGYNDCGQLGHGDLLSRYKPTRVKSLEGSIVIKIACGANNVAVLTDKGEIFAWYVYRRTKVIYYFFICRYLV
jgi:RCC1 and BTB domain-containing protein